MFDIQKALYYASPLWLKRLYATIPYPVRLGRHFRRVRRLLDESESWSEEQHRHYQTTQLQSLLRTAFKRVPFYREWAKKEAATAEDFRSPEDVRRLPLISKQLILENWEAFVRENRCRLFYSTDATGGTTGQQFRFLTDNAAYRKEQGFMSHMWERVGYWIMAPKATLRGRAIHNPKTANCWTYTPIHNELTLSVYELTERTLPAYVTACVEFGVQFLHGYPSAISILAKLLDSHPDQQARFPKLIALLITSEALLPGQRELMERVFGCRLFSWYGMSEKVILAGECEKSSLYHVFPQYGITELVDDEGRNIDEPGVEGELVGTGFLNSVMPFIRYRTGDASSWVAGACEHCSRQYPRLASVRGRWSQKEGLVSRDGRFLTVTGVVGAMHGPEFSHVERFQLYQDTPGRVELRILAGEGFGERDLRRIRNALEAKLTDFELEIKLVDNIPLTPRGKAVHLIQKLSLEDRGAVE